MKIKIPALLLALTGLAHGQTNVTVSANIHSILQASNYAAVRGLLDLEAGIDFLSPSAIAAAYQPLDADLTAWAAVAPGSYLSISAAAAAYQPLSANLTSWATISTSGYISSTAIAAGYQPLDSDLTTIGGLADPNADRILGWDDSAGAYVHFTLGTNLSTTGTTINAAGGGGGMTDPLNFTAASILTIASGAVTATQTLHILAAESGVTDTVDSIAGGVEGDVLIVRPDSGDAITLADGTSGGDNLDLAGQNVLLNSTNESVTLIHNGTNWTILAVSPSLLTVDLTGQQTDTWIIAASDETTDLTTGTSKVRFLAPYAATITGIVASVTTAPTGASLIADVNATSATVMTTNKLTIEATETRTLDATTQPTVTDTSIAQWEVITIDIDQVGSTVPGKGLKIYIQHSH
ncbi:MAG: hypothetical protein EOP87_00145 [Verrucomicrobiaceae bacterium]|nr:MAG: hypothetical protein EOP87_00145 [Verrucomicrobiaceae bacterium]